MKRIITLLIVISLFFTSCELFLTPYQGGALTTILIGSNEENLPNSPNDAKALSTVLKRLAQKYGRAYSETRFITNESAAFNKEEVLSEVTTHASELKKDDLLLFYYSGHGNKTSINIGEGITPVELYDALSSRKEGKILLIIDACYSGIFIPSQQSSHITVITASRDDEESWSGYGGKSYSYFTYILLSALGHFTQQDTPPALYQGVLTAGSLYAEIRAHTETHNQTPMSIQGPLDVVLFADYPRVK